MGINKKLHSRNKEDILQALTLLNEHVLDNKKRLIKALKERDYVIDKDGNIIWSPFLLSGKLKLLDKATEEKLTGIDLIEKIKEFMEKSWSYPIQFHLDIIEFCDGFQINLSVEKDTSEMKKDKTILDSISYFIFKSY